MRGEGGKEGEWKPKQVKTLARTMKENESQAMFSKCAP